MASTILGTSSVRCRTRLRRVDLFGGGDFLDGAEYAAFGARDERLLSSDPAIPDGGQEFVTSDPFQQPNVLVRGASAYSSR
jgi:hypothetical protein